MVLDIENVLKDNSKVAQTIFVKIPILIIRKHFEDENNVLIFMLIDLIFDQLTEDYYLIL